MNLLNSSSFTSDKNNAIIYFIAVALSTAITLSPAIMLRYVDMDIALFIVLLFQLLTASVVYFFFLRKTPGYTMKIDIDAGAVKLLAFLFLLIFLIQLTVYCFRDYLYHYKSSQINWMAVLVLTIIVPFYEEIVFRACTFAFLYAVFRKNSLASIIITSLFFCLMHLQYYNTIDQIVLFLVSVMLLIARIKTRSLLYPMVMHSGMNAFVIFLNIQTFL